MTLARPIDPGDAADAARWRALSGRVAEPGLAAFVAGALDHAEAGPLVRAAFAYSPFLADCLLREPGVLQGHVEAGPDAVLGGLMAAQAKAPLDDRARFMAGLRRTRRRIALLTALADLGGAWDLGRVTGSLSAFADLACKQALSQAVLDAAARRDLDLAGPGDDPGASAGLVVLAMGKHGAGELNYSSDIDLIVLFEPGRLRGGRESPLALATRLTRSLVHLLEHKTADGYAFRTDLRLRPHPPGHPLTLSIEEAELYYERHGQNWERAALIKARPVAGDLVLGRRFLDWLRPFVWRRHLDFAAIRDIHSIKRQINAHRGHGAVAVPGHDLKVGRGGIREIEFFVQTQQLILGGRHPELRDGRTLPALRALADGRWIDETAADDLAAAYGTLRALEHRLQMVADRQTQALPSREGELERFARFAGFADADALGAALERVLRTVERHYAALFEREVDLGAGGHLVFTGTHDDPATLDTLTGLGFSDPSAVSGRIRDWHHGHINATRSTRARELLTELTPGLLAALTRQPDPDGAFRLFDAFVTSLPGGVQIFSLIRANPRLLVFLCDVMGAAPGLARALAADISLFDAVLNADFLEPLPDRAALEAELGAKLGDARDLEDVLDICRRWAHGRQFQAGLHVLMGQTAATEAQIRLTELAGTVIRTLLPEAERWLKRAHGEVVGGAFAVLGLGKLGSRELTIGSDLDLVFVFDAQEGALSNGAKPLPAATYYARLGQNLVNAIAARTAEGRLYEIDTRLRPSGNAGPVACSLSNFMRYHAQTAKVWEQQALTRARVVAGDGNLARIVAAGVEDAVRRERDAGEVAREVRAMRLRIFKEHGRESPWALKHARGGLVEIEFVAQFLQLAHAERHPKIRHAGTAAVFEAAGEVGLLSPDAAERLVRTLRLHHALQAVLRLSGLAAFDPKTAPEGLRRALVGAVDRELGLGLPQGHLAAVEAMLEEGQAFARATFDRLCPPEGG
ncbi:MAG: bifunctional [glutamine synthetase] adenylyltransferase/[glutamine synthetase]-adenylyl-L-tyrosine phosphorylase [Geminicoccaceae bacterium]|nr:bifunctional [glutamine synthetase] adenylyltransferase/[glutamine synthetase]-adenylyl-L-tyrosine phosphorylase [Geminicoccaceae bacterium]